MFLDLVKKRRSVRRYLPDPVPRDMIEKCIEAATYAPTACNTQSWRFFVLEGELKKELVKHVRTEIGPIASPDVIHWAPGLPKTRSGKIMRRILRKIASDEADQIGDTSTLADPSVVDNLIKNK